MTVSDYETEKIVIRKMVQDKLFYWKSQIKKSFTFLMFLPEYQVLQTE